MKFVGECKSRAGIKFCRYDMDDFFNNEDLKAVVDGVGSDRRYEVDIEEALAASVTCKFSRRHLSLYARQPTFLAIDGNRLHK